MLTAWLAGMSTRAIAPIVGANHNTVARDIASVSNDTDRTVHSMDGIARTCTRKIGVVRDILVWIVRHQIAPFEGNEMEIKRTIIGIITAIAAMGVASCGFSLFAILFLGVEGQNSWYWLLAGVVCFLIAKEGNRKYDQLGKGGGADT